MMLDGGTECFLMEIDRFKEDVVSVVITPGLVY